MTGIDRALGNSRYTHLGNSHTPAAPQLKLAVLTCMDARIDVFKLLGLRPGDAHVVRNAGGRVTEDVIRSLALSQLTLGTDEVMVMHHTGCALSGGSEEELRRELGRVAGEPPPFAIGCFDDDLEAVREDVGKLRASAFLAHREQVRGFLYDIARGQLVEVR
jgi:carbonic anhydrase